MNWEDYLELGGEQAPTEEEILLSKLQNMEPPPSPKSTIGYSGEGIIDIVKGQFGSQSEASIQPEEYMSVPSSMFSSQEDTKEEFKHDVSEKEDVFEAPTKKNLLPLLNTAATDDADLTPPAKSVRSASQVSVVKATKNRAMAFPLKVLKNEDDVTPIWMITYARCPREPWILMNNIKHYVESDKLRSYYHIQVKILFGIAMLEWGTENGCWEPHIHLLLKFENTRISEAPNKEFMLHFSSLMSFHAQLKPRDIDVRPVSQLMRGLAYLSKALPLKLDHLTYEPISVNFKQDKAEIITKRWCMMSFDPKMPIGTYTALIKNEVNRRLPPVPFESSPNVISDSDSTAFNSPAPAKKTDDRTQIDCVPIKEFEEAIYDKEGGIYPYANTFDHDRPAWLNLVVSRTLLLYKGKTDYIFDKLTLFIIKEGLSIGEAMNMIDLNTGYRWFLSKMSNTQKALYAKFTPTDTDRLFPDINAAHNSAMARLKERFENITSYALGDPSKKQLLHKETLSIQRSKDTLLKLTRWLKTSIQNIVDKRFQRNRHLWVYGAGSNGKTSFVNWLRKNFKCQLLTACDKYLLTELDYTHKDFYIFDEFNLNNHIGNVTITLEVFNNMLGQSCNDEAQFDALHNDLASWPDVNVKGTMGKTHPCATFIFLTNIPILPRLREQVADDLLSNFKLRFSTQLNFERFEKLPEEVCIFNTCPDRKIDDLSIEELEKQARDEDMIIPDFGPIRSANDFGY